MAPRETTESCTLCEKLTLSVIFSHPVRSLQSLPTTMNPRTGTYEWHTHGIASYVLVPRSVYGVNGTIDCYCCCDEDDLDDINLVDYTAGMIREVVLKNWNTITSFTLAVPSLSHLPGIPCCKHRHPAPEES